MRRAAKVDSNHAAIVRALRQIGVSVQSLASVGSGVPDLLCGFLDARGMPTNLLLEVKDGEKPRHQTRLTEDEAWWHALWKGAVETVWTEAQAVALVRRYSGRPDIPAAPTNRTRKRAVSPSGAVPAYTAPLKRTGSDS